MAEITVDRELYNFLKENETHIYQKNKNIIVWAVVKFWDIDDFVKIIDGCFSEYGLEITMFKDYLAVEIQDIIIDSFGHNLKDYQDCFKEDEWEVINLELLNN